MDTRWRLILRNGRNAAENMGIDESIFRACACRESPPTLRLYSWARPAISLGRLQRFGGASGIDTAYCADHGIEIVRRPTGGRAVLHGHDLTFSIAMSQRDLPPDCTGVAASHKWLMRGILHGLRLLGIGAEMGADAGRQNCRDQPDDCFARIASCDVQAQGIKLAGAAQARGWGGLLEQGSLPHDEPSVDPVRVFGGRRPSPPVIRASGTDLEEAVIRGFQAALGMCLEPGTLSKHEEELAENLTAIKYCTDEWTACGEFALTTV